MGETTMRQYVFSKNYELHHLAELMPQGATIRVLSDNDVARVGNIVVLTALSMGAGEKDLILEVTPAPAEEATPDTDDSDEEDSPEEAADGEEEEGKDCYW